MIIITGPRIPIVLYIDVENLLLIVHPRTLNFDKGMLISMEVATCEFEAKNPCIS